MFRTDWLKRQTRNNLIPPAFALAAILAPLAYSIYHVVALPSEFAQAAGGSAPDVLTFTQLALFDAGLTLAVVSVTMILYRWRLTRLFLHLALFTVLAELFYRVVYHGPVTASVMFAVVGTSPREAGELLAAHPVLTGLLFLVALAATYTSVMSWGAWNPFRAALCLRASMISALLIVASLALLWWQASSEWMLKQAVKAQIVQNFPFDVGNSIRKVAQYSVSARRYSAARAAFAFKDVRLLEADSRRAEAEIYVVVIGESSRRSNWSLFGYPRSTTPDLDAIRDELTTVDHLTSNATVTALSVAQALTRASPNSWWRASSEKSIIALLRQAGFSVTWISNQERFGAYASLISTIALDASSSSYTEELPQSFRTDRFDSNLLTRMDSVLKGIPENGKTVIFLHMMGSHLNYADRYPAAFDVFHGSSDVPRKLSDKKLQVVDKYDNSILFTDYISRGVIDRLKQCRCKAAMVYFSDHGERLFDSEDESGADFGHGFSTISREEVAIPFFVWMSSQYKAANPSSVAALKKNSQSYAQLHSLFETLVDLAGVDYQGRDESLSLFSNEFESPRSLEFLNISEHSVSLPLEFADSTKAHTPHVGSNKKADHRSDDAT